MQYGSSSDYDIIKSKLNTWLCDIKSKMLEKYTENNKNSNEELLDYFSELSKLEETFNALITREDTEKLKKLEFPLDLIEHIKDMNQKPIILDIIHTSLIIYPYNTSASHAEELSKETIL
jgi:hypothetical protein